MTAKAGVRRLGGAAVVAVLCIAALAAAGSPGHLDLGDPAWWLAAVVVVLSVAALAWAAVALLRRYDRPREHRERRAFDRSGLLTYLLIVAVAGAVFWAGFRLLPSGGRLPQPAFFSLSAPARQSLRPGSGGGYDGPDLTPYIVILVGLAVLALLVYVVVNRVRSIPEPVEEPELAAGEALAAAIDAALIDLEAEDDPRRAVIKAYGRMERVLSAQGLPRDPAEAPLEYLDRVLRELGGRAAEVDRLTELFEHAAFSKHEVGLAMRDDAVAAFHALRDSLAATAGGGL